MRGQLRQDLRYACRALRRQPASAVMALVTLGLGIGANAAIITVINAVYLRPLPYERPEELTFIWSAHERRSLSRAAVPYDDVDALRSVGGLQDIARYQHTELTLSTAAESMRVGAVRMDERLLPLLGATPARGRGIAASETASRAGRVVILADQVWRERFGADPNAIGQTVTIDAEPYEIIGVMDRQFAFPPHPDLPERPLLFVPLARPAPQMARMGRVYTALARRSPGVSIAALQAGLDAAAAAAAATDPRTHGGWRYRALSVREQVGEGSRQTLLLLLAATTVLLLVACANVSTLLLARAASRHREFGIQLALGSTTARLVRQLAIEGLLLGLTGGAIGLLLGYTSVALLRGSLPASLQRLDELRLDPSLAFFVVALAALSACIFSAAPALYLSRTRATSALRDDARGTTQSRALRRLHNGFAFAEIALAALLLAFALSLGRSFQAMAATPSGFDADRALALDVTLPAARYANPERTRTYYRHLFAALDRIPGVNAAGGINLLPPSDANLAFPFVIEGQNTSDGSTELRANFRVATGGYFAAMGIPLLNGRSFAEQDDTDGVPVVMVNRALVDRFFEGRSPIGTRLTVMYGMGAPITREIVGIVGNVRQSGPGEDPRPELYLPYGQETFRWMTVVARTASEPAQGLTALRQAVRAIDADVAVDDVAPVRARASRVLEDPRFRAAVVATFAAMALGLAFAGVAGVMGFAVTARLPELSVRLAIGARPADLRDMVVRDGLSLAVMGSLLGTGVALIATRYAAAAGLGLPGADMASAAVAAVTVTLAALVAIGVPAVRASRVDPLRALR